MGRPKGSKNKPAHESIEMEAQVSTQEIAHKEVNVIADPAVFEDKQEKPQLIRKLSPAQVKEIEDQRLVTGTFVYRAKPGGRYKTALRKYKKDPFSKFPSGIIPIDMVDGQKYTVPNWIAEWLNGENPDLGCVDFKHNAANINIETEGRGPAERIPVFRFIVQGYA